MRSILLLALTLLAACAPQRPHPQASAPAPEPVRNEAIFAGDLPGEALLFDLRRDDLDGGPVGAIDIDRPRATHMLTLEIDANGPFLLEAHDSQGVRFRHVADASDRLTLPARRGRIEITIFPRGEGLTQIRAIARYGEDFPPQGEPPPRAARRAHVEAEPLLPPDATPRTPDAAPPGGTPAP